MRWSKKEISCVFLSPSHPMTVQVVTVGGSVFFSSFLVFIVVGQCFMYLFLMIYVPL